MLGIMVYEFSIGNISSNRSTYLTFRGIKLCPTALEMSGKQASLPGSPRRAVLRMRWMVNHKDNEVSLREEKRRKD